VALLRALLGLLLGGEFRKNLLALLEGVLFLLLAFSLALGGVGFLFAAFYLLLAAYLPPWAASALTGLAALGLGGVLFALGRRR